MANINGIKISNYDEHEDGISFTVETELEAYKAAYYYQHTERVNVKKCPCGWLVQVYQNEI